MSDEDVDYIWSEMNKECGKNQFFSNSMVAIWRTHSMCEWEYMDDGVDKDVLCKCGCGLIYEIRYAPDATNRNLHDHSWRSIFKGLYKDDCEQLVCECGMKKFVDKYGNPTTVDKALGWDK